MKRLAEFGLVTVAAGWGLTFTLVQDAVDSLPALTFVAYRFLLATAVMVIPYHRELRRFPREGWLYATTLGLLLLAAYITQTVGLHYTTASNGGFITGLYVVLTPVLGWLFLRQHATSWTWFCIVLAGAGLVLLSGFGGVLRPLGDLLMLVCAISIAAHILVTDRAIKQVGVGPLVAASLGICGFSGLVVAALFGQLALPSGSSVWTALLFTALVASAFAYLVQSYAQKQISPARTSLILATEPAFAGVFGFALAGDRLSALGWMGAATMLAAVLLADLGQNLFTRRPRART